MKFLKLILNFYINTSIHVAVAVFSLVQITKLNLNISINSNINYFIFFGTIIGYNFLKYFVVFWNRTFTFKNNYEIVLVSIIAFFGMTFYFFRLDSIYQKAFLKIGVVILIYPFVRKFGLIKMAFVCFCLTFITVYIPTINQQLNCIYMLERFVIIFCLLIPLEIYDLEIDSRTIKTLPKIIGIQNLKLIGYFLLLFFSILGSNFEIITIVIAICIFLSNEKNSKFFTSFWVESLPIIWWGILFFQNIL